MDDVTLIRDAARGSEDAFELLVRRHVDATWRLAASMLRDDHEAEDAVQDTFLKVYGSLSTFRGESSARTWLLQICRRTCLDRIRGRRAEVVPLDAVRAMRARDQRPDLRVALSDALAGLDRREHEAFVLVDVLGYTREEAATIVGVPSSTMRSRVTRARSRLAEAIGEGDDEAVNGGT